MRSGRQGRPGFLAPLVFLLACASAPPPAQTTTAASSAPAALAAPPTVAGTPPGERAPTPLEMGALRRLMGEAQRTRRLSFTAPVHVEVHDAERIAARLDGQIEDEDVEKAQLVYGTLGLLPEGLDLRGLLREVLGEQVLGYYDTDEARLVVREDVMEVLARRATSAEAAEARIVIVHELVHALQDQALRLGEAWEVERDSDADNALRALVEGDATLAMMVYAAEKLGVPLEALAGDAAVETLMAQSVGAGDDALGRAPPILRHTLVTPYVAGLRFARELRRAGDWRAVDGAFDRKPASTEQVLHPRRYLQGEEPDPIALPAFPALEEAGLEPVEEDTLGELEVAVFLGRGTESGVDAAAADGWGGDRLRVYRWADGRSELGVAVWFLTFDDEAEAREAEAAARRTLGADELRREGRALLVTLRLPQALRPPVDAAFVAFEEDLPPTPPRRPSTIAP